MKKNRAVWEAMYPLSFDRAATAQGNYHPIKHRTARYFYKFLSGFVNKISLSEITSLSQPGASTDTSVIDDTLVHVIPSLDVAYPTVNGFGIVAGKRMSYSIGDGLDLATKGAKKIAAMLAMKLDLFILNKFVHKSNI